MKKILLSIFLFSGYIAFGQKSDSSFGKPIFWYQVSDPWAMFIGAEGPVFILYSTGKVLFWNNGNYKQAQLSDQEKEEVISELHLNDKIFQKTQVIDATTDDTSQKKIITPDQPSYIAYLNLDTVIHLSVYGNIKSKDFRRRFPSQILNVHDFVLNFSTDQSTDWLPEKVEILLSDYSHSPDRPIPWPKGWPDLNSTDTRMNTGYATSIFLDKKYFTQLAKLIKKRREKQAFEINGRKYFVDYRFPIPGIY